MATSSRTRCDWCERPHRATSHESFAPRERIRRFHLLCDQLNAAKERTAHEYSHLGHCREAALRVIEAAVRTLGSFANVPHDELYDASLQPLERITSALNAALPSILNKSWRDPSEMSAADQSELCMLLGAPSNLARLDDLLARALDDDEPTYVAGGELHTSYRALIRLPLQLTYACAVPNDAVVRALARYAPLIEIGAGSGYWGGVLRSRGIECELYDIAPPMMGATTLTSPWFHKAFAHVKRGEAVEGFAAFPTHALLLVWPYHSGAPTCWDVEALDAYKGEIVCHVGDLTTSRACGNGRVSSKQTTSAEFCRRLEMGFACELRLPIGSWPMCEDEMTVWRRR